MVGPFLRSATNIAANYSPISAITKSDQTKLEQQQQSSPLSKSPEPVIASPPTPAQLNASSASISSTTSNNGGVGSKFLPSKKWYKNSANASTHSFYAQHHLPSHLNMPAFSVENIGSSILTPEQLTLIWRWLPTR